MTHPPNDNDPEWVELYRRLESGVSGYPGVPRMDPDLAIQIWQWLAQGDDLLNQIDSLPADQRSPAAVFVGLLWDQYDHLVQRCYRQYRTAIVEAGTACGCLSRQALQFRQAFQSKNASSENREILDKMFAGEPFDYLVWEQLRPDAILPEAASIG